MNFDQTLTPSPGQLVHDGAQVLQAVRLAPRAIKLSSDGLTSGEFHDDQEIMLAVVAQNGNLLKVASARLRASKEVVMVAVRVRAAVGRRGPPGGEGPRDRGLRSGWLGGALRRRRAQGRP